MQKEVKVREDLLYELHKMVGEAQRRIWDAWDATLNSNDTIIVDNVSISREQAHRIYSLCLKLSVCSGIEAKKHTINEELKFAQINEGDMVTFLEFIKSCLINNEIYYKKIDLIPEKLVNQVEFWAEFKKIIDEVLIA